MDATAFREVEVSRGGGMGTTYYRELAASCYLDGGVPGCSSHMTSVLHAFQHLVDYNLNCYL